MKTHPYYYSHIKSLLAILAAIPIVFLLAGHAFAGSLIDNSTNLTQQQQMRQKQGQRQGQEQELNNNPTTTQTTEFNDRRQVPSVGGGAPSFGAAVSDGYLNACAGSEAWSIDFRAGFVIPNSGAPLGIGVGGGDSELVTINLCEVREAAHMVGMRLDGEDAEKLHHAIMCQHPSYRTGVQAIGMTCPTIQPYSMEVALGDQTEVVTTTTTTRVAQAPGCEIYQSCWKN